MRSWEYIDVINNITKDIFNNKDNIINIDILPHALDVGVCQVTEKMVLKCIN